MRELPKLAAVYIAIAALFYLLRQAAPYFAFEVAVALGMALAVYPALILMRYGLINFGVALYYGIGAYSAAFLYEWGVNNLAALVVAAGATAAALGLAVGWLTARFRGVYYAMINLALSMAVYGLIIKLYKYTGGSDGLPTPYFPTSYVFVALLVASVAASALALAFERSPLGRASEGIRLNEVRARALGIGSEAHITLATALSAAFAGVGGAANGILYLRAFPDYLYWSTSAQLVVGAILGFLAPSYLGFLVGGATITALGVAASWSTNPELVWGAALLALLPIVLRIWRY